MLSYVFYVLAFTISLSNNTNDYMLVEIDSTIKKIQSYHSFWLQSKR